jgi:hypothetical protein
MKTKQLNQNKHSNSNVNIKQKREKKREGRANSTFFFSLYIVFLFNKQIVGNQKKKKKKNDARSEETRKLLFSTYHSIKFLSHFNNFYSSSKCGLMLFFEWAIYRAIIILL